MLFRVGLIGTLIFCAGASAALTRGTYAGGGEWKAPSGAKGKWKMDTTVTQDANGYTFKEALTVTSPDGQSYTENTEWSAVNQANGFFDVTMGGKKIGWGYCFQDVCQLQGQGRRDTESYGETFKFMNKGFARMGWEVGANGTIAWQGGQVRK